MQNNFYTRPKVQGVSEPQLYFFLSFLSLALGCEQLYPKIEDPTTAAVPMQVLHFQFTFGQVGTPPPAAAALLKVKGG
jgi:hypothetical protein